MFRNDLEAVAARTRAFYASEEPSAIIHIKSIADSSPAPMPPLTDFHFPTDMEKYLDMRAERLASYWEVRKDIDDDLFPSIAPWYGIAEHTAFLGGEVEFSADTSYNHVILPDWKDFDKLTLDENNPWLRLVVDGIAHYRKKWGNLFAPKLRGADGPSDIANIIRGNELFYDVYDEPELVKQLASFCADAIRFTFERQKAAAGTVCGGYVTGFDVWMEGNCIGQISEDASCMMSPAIFEELFLDALKKTVAGFDSVMLHVHSLGEAMIPIFASVPEIKVIEISNDPNAPRSFDVWRKYRRELSGKAVIVTPTFDEMRANIDLLKEEKPLVWYHAESCDDAKRAVEFVRSLH